MSMYFVAPGVYPETVDLSDRTQAPATSIGALVLVSNMGPMERTFVPNSDSFKKWYGLPNAKLGWGHHTALFFLEKSSMLYVKRVQRDSRYAGLTVFNDRNGNAATKTYVIPWNSGRFHGYSEDERGSQKIYTMVFSGPVLVAQSINCSTTTAAGGDAQTLSSAVTYATDSDNTLKLFAAALQTHLNTEYATVGKNIGGVGVISGGSGVDDDRVLWLIVPEDADFDLASVTVSGTGTPPTVAVYEHTALFEVFAQNPGAWGNDVGVQIRNVDNGVRQRRRLTFARAMTTNEQFKLGIQYGETTFQIAPVSYSTSQAVTAAAIKSAIETAIASSGTPAGWEVIVETGALEITVIAPVDGENRFTFLDPKVVNTSTPNVVSVVVTNTQVVAGVDRADAFDLWVYSRSNVNAPQEKFRCSLRYQINGFGEQEFIEEAVNISDQRSQHIRVLYNDAEDSDGGNTAGLIAGITSPTAICWMNGGTDTAQVLASDYMVAWNDFKDRRKAAVRLLLNGGVTITAVQQHMVALAEARRDCFAILDMPTTHQLANDGVEYRRNVGNFNSSYGAIYTPNVGRVDEFTNQKLFIPPSGFVGAAYADTDRKRAEWFAPAGFNNALINTVELRHEYDDGEVELLFSNNINPIVKRPGKGYPIWGAETLQSKASALSNVPVRRLLITIELTLVDALEYQVFEPNDPYTWFQATQVCNNLLQPIKEKRGLYNYLTVISQVNNKSYHIDMGLMNADILLKPVLPVKFIRLSSIVTKTGAVFSEIMGLLTGESNQLANV